MHIGFWWEVHKDIDVDGRIILKWILREIGLGALDCIRLAQDGDQWRALVNTAMNVWFP
jgi:hypothetical protein